MNIRIIGPSGYSRYAGHPFLVDVTAHAVAAWSRGLSPESLGPVRLYGGRKAHSMRNAWEFCKLFASDIGEDGMPNSRYWERATEGWNAQSPVRKQEGTGERAGFVWEGKRLFEVDARMQIFWPLYRNAVALTPSFTHLKSMAAQCPEVVLFDFDGYDEEREEMTLKDVLLNTKRPLSHAFVLKAMLLHGEQVTPQDVLSNNAQIALF